MNLMLESFMVMQQDLVMIITDDEQEFDGIRFYGVRKKMKKLVVTAIILIILII